MSGHTPGPWRADEISQVSGWICITSDHRDGNSLCSVTPKRNGTPDERGDDEREANARLIAASPMLLEALRDMVSDRNCLSEKTVEFAKAAIAKATGDRP